MMDDAGEGCIHMHAGICMHTYACMHACACMCIHRAYKPKLQTRLPPKEIGEHGQWQAWPVGGGVSPRRTYITNLFETSSLIIITIIIIMDDDGS